MAILIGILLVVGLALLAAGIIDGEFAGVFVGGVLLVIGLEALIFGTWHIFTFVMTILAIVMFFGFLASALS